MTPARLMLSSEEGEFFTRLSVCDEHLPFDLVNSETTTSRPVAL